MLRHNIIKCGTKEIDVSKKTIIMGILNITPDSFSDGGKYTVLGEAVSRAVKMVEEGADIIDIGGESTRPGAKTVGEEEELERVLPIIEAVSMVVDVPISIDTYKQSVAKQAVEAGATIINDVWGAKQEPGIAEVAANHNIPIVLTHNRHSKEYNNLIEEVIADLNESISLCKRVGVEDAQIILDPGIGFAKTYKQNIEVMQNLDKIVELGYPVLLGTSRKSFIGITLDLPADERLEGTQSTVCYGIMKGCQMMRVHDILQISRTAKMMDALVGRE
ncbi:dihydropteroate synthase [Anaerobacillus alkalilacustris]|uniref:Dihydropteroate synthase n=1 Tax=Anaerobacillus alkalilacustris TaxID=393763 RepID=A0A1S2LZ08_9BACI|nr:dihydropteroate synthase [Anaerobacillus alkalilacustris]OIJ17524.1 dihydropteroate synthase [Anaerobacillus alkalilacustris]